MATMRPTVESWAWNSSMESCFSPSTSHWCFSLHHHIHHHPCNMSLRTSNAPGPASPPIPVHGHEVTMGGEVSVRDVFGGFVTDGEGRGGALLSGAGDGASLSSQGSGGESEYCVPPRYTPCAQAKSNSSSSSASTASNSTCSSLSCSWYDKPKPGQPGGATALAPGEDSSHVGSPNLPRVPGVPSLVCPKQHHHHHASMLATNAGDSLENYDTPKNVASNPCATMEISQKSGHHIQDNPCHPSVVPHCDHYDTPRKVKEALAGVHPGIMSGTDHTSAAGNYDIPLRFHHIPCCCAGHNVSSSTTCGMAQEQKFDGRHGVDEKGLTAKPHHMECTESLSPSSVRMSNESALDVKSIHKSRCGVVGVSTSEYYKYPCANEMSHCMSRACCHADSNCCMGNWYTGLGKAECRENAKFKDKAALKSSNLYENLNFAQSLEHYENVKELLVRSELDRNQTACQGMRGNENSGGDNHSSSNYPGGESSQHLSRLTYDKDGVKLCKKCGHSFWCPLKEIEARPCNASSEIYSNLSALNQSLIGTCNTDLESSNQSPKKTFFLGRLPEKSASIPCLHQVSLQFESGLLQHKSRYHLWRYNSAPTLCKTEENFSTIWDFPHQRPGGRAHQNVLGEDLYAMVGFYPCTCRDLMAGCIRRGKPGNSQSEGKFTPHLQSTGPTSLNSSVVSSTTASAISLQLPSSSRIDSCAEAKKAVIDNNTLPSSAEECAEPSSSCHQAAAEGNRHHLPANNMVHIVRRSSAHAGRPMAAANGGNRDSSGSNDSGVSSTGSVGGGGGAGGGLVPNGVPPPCPSRPPSPSHSQCRRSRVITHPSPWCFHASLPHPKSNCSLRSSTVHSNPHLETLRSRSCSDPLRTLACTPPLTPASGMAVMATCSESSDSPGSLEPKNQD